MPAGKDKTSGRTQSSQDASARTNSKIKNLRNFFNFPERMVDSEKANLLCRVDFPLYSAAMVIVVAMAVTSVMRAAAAVTASAVAVVAAWLGRLNNEIPGH